MIGYVYPLDMCGGISQGRVSGYGVSNASDFAASVHLVCLIQDFQRFCATAHGLGLVTQCNGRVGMTSQFGDKADFDTLCLQCGNEGMPRRMVGNVSHACPLECRSPVAFQEV